jgi:hypothetical protein
MFYRRKILLGLLEACGGELTRTDMEKLLFLFCKEKGVSYYDFFPYRFGCFSLLSYQDKRVLTQQGCLAYDEDFRIGSCESFSRSLETEDKLFLIDFALRTKHLRGDALVRHVYLTYPYYASRSEIRERVLTKVEQAMIEPYVRDKNDMCLFTIGYEGLTIDAYIDKLISNNIAMVIDVRRNPISMKYGFSKSRFSNYLNRSDIFYKHFPELGIASSQRKNLETKKDYTLLFKRYAATTLPRYEDKLENIRRLLGEHKRIALTCFEAETTSCHRHKITERLQANKNWNIPITNI